MIEVLARAMPVVCESVTSIIVLFRTRHFGDAFQVGAHSRISSEVGLAKNICTHFIDAHTLQGKDTKRMR